MTYEHAAALPPTFLTGQRKTIHRSRSCRVDVHRAGNLLIIGVEDEPLEREPPSDEPWFAHFSNHVVHMYGDPAMECEPITSQIDRLARVLMDEFGGPTHPEGAIDTAIRFLREQQKKLTANGGYEQGYVDGHAEGLRTALAAVESAGAKRFGERTIPAPAGDAEGWAAIEQGSIERAEAAGARRVVVTDAMVEAFIVSRGWIPRRGHYWDKVRAGIEAALDAYDAPRVPE